MSDAARFPSLLPYLKPGKGGARLDLVQPARAVGAGGFGNPFRVVLEGSAVSRIVEGAWKTDTGSLVQDVFLVMQRDTYPWTGREAGRLDNPAIEGLWRKTHTFCSTEEPDTLMVLGEQLDETHQLVAFQSLFYCKGRQHFFHPPCPQCGLPLELCREDALLIASDLLPYSRSLKRYLYCPSCAPESPVFYAFERASHDPPFVRDRFALLVDFVRTPASAAEESGFPCVQCEDASSCHGASSIITSQIVPFSFYPFHCLMFRAMPLNAAEFLILLSAGSLADVRGVLERQGELGRLKTLKSTPLLRSDRVAFLFREDERFFLEVLYLKLSFLAEAVGKLRRGAECAHEVGAEPSVDQLWVSLPDQLGQLPGAWSFGLHVADVFSPLAASTSHALTGLRGMLYSIGLNWFQTLLTNETQDATRISHALDDLLDRRLAEGTAPGSPPPWDQAGVVFGAENVFWHRESLPRDVPWSVFWEESLNLGWMLLAASHASTRDWSWAGFEWQVAALRDRLRQALFSPAVRVEQPVAEDTSTKDVEAIHAALTEIQQTWRQQAAAGRGLQGPTEPKSPTVVASVAEEDTLPLGMQWRPEDDELVETVLVGGKAAAEEPSPPPGPVPEASLPEEALPETIILPSKSPARRVGDPRSPAPSPTDHREPLEGADSGRMAPLPEPRLEAMESPPRSPEQPEKHGEEEDERGKPESEEASFSDEDTYPGPGFDSPEVPPEEDDLLMETIILSPRKGPEAPDKKN